jgi:hypothetical protein
LPEARDGLQGRDSHRLMARYRRGWSTGWRKSTSGGREWYDSSWELQYMDELDRDALVARWTRHHGLRIPYRKWLGTQGHYEPDFLVELVDGDKELREVKGDHLFADRNTKLKLKAGDEFCRRRSMRFKVITKGSVNPETWRPSAEISVDEAPVPARPALAEDAYSTERSGCLGVVLAVIALASLAVATCLLLILR